jgi:hypothetical protein
MQQRQLGPFTVSAIGLGCMNICHAYGAPVSTEQAERVLLARWTPASRISTRPRSTALAPAKPWWAVLKPSTATSSPWPASAACRAWMWRVTASWCA